MAIHATCYDCADVEFEKSQLTVRVCAETDDASYRFRCPDCSKIVVREATFELVDRLIQSGVGLEIWHLPGELFEDKEGDPIDYDDIIDFHRLLDRKDWFSTLSRMVTRDVVQPGDELDLRLSGELIARAEYLDYLPDEYRKALNNKDETGWGEINNT